jgi:hypothetical protein
VRNRAIEPNNKPITSLANLINGISKARLKSYFRIKEKKEINCALRPFFREKIAYRMTLA